MHKMALCQTHGQEIVKMSREALEGRLITHEAMNKDEK